MNPYIEETCAVKRGPRYFYSTEEKYYVKVNVFNHDGPNDYLIS